MDEPLGEPTAVKGHRMQHPDPPSWCVDCGIFYPEDECASSDSGDFDQRTERGRHRILSIISGIDPEEPHA